MSVSAFDPFDLPSSFDPLGNEGPPPPRRRRVVLVDADAPPHGAGAGGRLAHLLKPDKPAAATGPSRTTGSAPVDETAARLLALGDEVAVLTDRFDGLQATVTARLDEQQQRIVQAATALVDARLRRAPEVASPKAR